MEILQSWFDSVQWPVLSAFILGLMTAISPCPMATNITAIAYIGKDVADRRRVFINGLVYTLGRAISYTALGFLFYFGASQFQLSGFLQMWGEKILGPLLIIIGLLMLDVFRINFPGLGRLTEAMEHRGRSGFWGALLLGMVFALAFCPYSGVLYFGMLIPMTITSASGLYLPVVFAIATGLPVIILAWVVAYTLSSIGDIYEKIKAFELWFRRIVALVFIGTGIYYLTFFFI